jgi:hypothetical protein
MGGIGPSRPVVLWNLRRGKRETSLKNGGKDGKQKAGKREPTYSREIGQEWLSERGREGQRT